MSRKVWVKESLPPDAAVLGAKADPAFGGEEGDELLPGFRPSRERKSNAPPCPEEGKGGRECRSSSERLRTQ
jgi:hypothetical protein